MDGSELFGKILKVSPAKTREDGKEGGKEGLGSRVAIWEQVSSDLLSRGICFCFFFFLRVKC